MKILQIHKYYNRKRGGGSVSAFFETKELLEKRGHEVMIFSMTDKDNEISKENKYFANHFDIRKTKSIFHKLWLIPRIIYNKDAIEKLDKLLTDKKPDIAHVHNIYHYLTPGIFKVLKKHKVPIVFKLSDYHAVCPNYKLFANGKIDNSCKDKKYYKLFFNKSINNSYSESLVAMIEGYVNKWCKFYEDVNVFTAPSEFMRKLVVDYGIPRKKVKILRNVLNFNAYEQNYKKQKVFLYMGRLSNEKGLIVALEAMKILKERKTLGNWQFIIAGKGPQEDFLRKYVQNNKIEDVVKFVGFHKKGSNNWKQLMNSAAVGLLPSIWYDNSPIAISESMAFGSSVIVSDYGGTKEMIEDKKSGFIFKTNDSGDLAQKMNNFIQSPDLINIMGRQAYERVKKINNEENYYQQLMEIYQSILE